MRRSRHLLIAATAALLVCPRAARSEAPNHPPVTAPRPPSAESADRFRLKALEFARRDMPRWAHYARQLNVLADEAAAKAAPAEQTHAETLAAKQAAEQQARSINAAIESATKSKQTAEQSLAEAKSAIETAQEVVANAEKVLTAAAKQGEQAHLDEQKAAAAAENATIAVSVFKQAHDAARRSVETVQSLIDETEQARQNAQQTIEQLQSINSAAQSAVDNSAMQLAKLAEEKKQADAAVEAAAAHVAQTEKSLKPLAEAKAAARKSADDAQAEIRRTGARIGLYESTVPAADPQALRLVQTYRCDRPVLACRFEGRGEFLLAGAEDAVMHRWDVIGGERTDLAGHRSWVRRFDVHEAGDLLVSGDYTGRVIWWDPLRPTPEPLLSIDAHKGYVRGVAISPDGRYVATGGNDNLVKIWSAVDGSLVAELAGHESHVYNLKFHPAGRRLVSGDLMGVLKEWEVDTWRHVRDFDASVLHKYDSGFRAHCGGIRGMDFSPDDRFLVVCGIAEVTNAFAGVGVPAAVLFGCESGRQLAVMKPAENFQGTCWGIRFHPTGRFIVGAGGGGSGMLWFWKTGATKSFHHAKMPSVAYDADFHPDGLRMAVALYDKTVRLYDIGPKVDVAVAESK